MLSCRGHWPVGRTHGQLQSELTVATATAAFVRGCYNSFMPVDTRLTYDDYCLLPNDGKRYEIIEGELLVTPSPLTLHQKVILNLGSYALVFVRKHDLGEVYCAPVDVVFSPYDVVQPDLLFVSKARRSIVTEETFRALRTSWRKCFPSLPRKSTAPRS